MAGQRAARRRWLGRSSRPRRRRRSPRSSATWAPTTRRPTGSGSSTPPCGCLAHQGTAKTTVDDIAREAGISRATVYRVFPGGKGEILAAVVDTEMARLFSRPGGGHGRGRRPRGRAGRRHRRGGRPGSPRTRPSPTWWSTSPGSVLPHLAFDEMDAPAADRQRLRGPLPRPGGWSRTRPPGRPSGRPASCCRTSSTPSAGDRPDRPGCTPAAWSRPSCCRGSRPCSTRPTATIDHHRIPDDRTTEPTEATSHADHRETSHDRPR